jgi:membrane-bound lytic murein transglycosylase B
MKTIKALSLVSLLIISNGCAPKNNQTTVIIPTHTTNSYPGSENVYPTQLVYPNQTQTPIIQSITQTVTEAPYLPPNTPYLQGAYQNNSKLKTFIAMMESKHHFNRNYLNAIFSSVSRDKEALTKIGAFVDKRKPQAKLATVESWDDYRGNFLTPARINTGVKFWKENQQYLNQASQIYGVAPEYIVGIIGVETNFGSYTGEHSVLNALTSIALEYPDRSPFFTMQLENYLLILKDEKIHPQKIKGSYAGAFGLSQFMPDSFRDYGVDLNHDGHINLFEKADAIGSVARFFKEKGKWSNSIPVAMQVYYSPSRFSGLTTGFKTRYAQSHLRSLGMQPSSNFYGYTGEVSLIKLHRYARDEMWWGTENFNAIARYNPKDFYAMAVHQLAQAIREAYWKQ